MWNVVNIFVWVFIPSPPHTHTSPSLFGEPFLTLLSIFSLFRIFHLLLVASFPYPLRRPTHTHISVHAAVDTTSYNQFQFPTQLTGAPLFMQTWHMQCIQYSYFPLLYNFNFCMRTSQSVVFNWKKNTFATMLSCQSLLLMSPN